MQRQKLRFFVKIEYQIASAWLYRVRIREGCTCSAWFSKTRFRFSGFFARTVIQRWGPQSLVLAYAT